MLLAFIHTDTQFRILPYFPCPERDVVCEKYEMRVIGRRAAEEVKWGALIVGKQTNVTIANILAVSSTEDVLVLGGYALFASTYRHLRRIYWLRTKLAFHSCPSLVQFDLQNWKVEEVSVRENGILSTLERRI